MAEISSTSSRELTERRRQLRRKRRGRWLQTSWQVLSMTGLTIGVIWMVTLPDWMVRDPSQIAVESSKSLAPDMIRSLVPLNYPQSILAIQPEAIARQLEKEAPIAEATVTRRMFPPGLTIRVQERHPVATVYTSPTYTSPTYTSPTYTSPTYTSPTSSMTLPSNQEFDNLFAVALLDETGVWMPYEKFTSFHPNQKLPKLKVVGVQEQYRSQWADLYRMISRSPIKVSLIDWREPSNLVLQTEIGTVHFGPFSSRFSQQLQVLDKMRKLSDNVESDQVAYIDLSNPDRPMLELVSGASKSPRSDD